MIKSLKEFPYPKELHYLDNVIQELSKNFFYEDKECIIEIFTDDARKVLKELDEKNIKIDIVYQDPFSSEVNKSLWTLEYFQDIEKVLQKDGIVTTYSIATPVRLSMYESGLYIYEIESEKKKSTLAFKEKKQKGSYKYIDMELKKQRNKEAKPLRDEE